MTTTTGAAGDFDDQDHTLLTKEGLKKLKEELDFLKKTRRLELAERLKEAISYGDLSENSEYEEAKNEQAFVEGRIIELEMKVKNAKIISDKKVSGGIEANVGSTVTVRNKTDNEEPQNFTIVGTTEADPMNEKLSNESPIGRALLGSKKGDILTVDTPSGIQKYEVIKVA
ncbi:MAG: transcription elongation factor GreA [bacterium]|nr:transcription elongation factor GreA [bacterium]